MKQRRGREGESKGKSIRRLLIEEKKEEGEN
jgi:hypothetical protein